MKLLFRSHQHCGTNHYVHTCLDQRKLIWIGQLDSGAGNQPDFNLLRSTGNAAFYNRNNDIFLSMF